MKHIFTSKEIIKEWCEKNLKTHTDWTGTRVETEYKCESVDEFVDKLYEYLEDKSVDEFVDKLYEYLEDKSADFI